MKYRTKLYLAFSSLIVGTIVLDQGLTYSETRKLFFNELRSKVTGVAVTASKLLDKDLLESVSANPREGSQDFLLILKNLREVRDGNRKEDLRITYIYLIQPDPQNPGQLIVVADAAENREVYAPPGTVYQEGLGIGILDHIDEPYSPHRIVEDRWGKFLPGYAPIYNSEGKYIATIGVNLSIDYVNEYLNHLKSSALIAMSISLAASLLIATFIANGITNSLKLIYDGVIRIGRGDWKTKVKIRSKDEFSELGTAINAMAVGLQERERLKLNFVRYVSKHVMDIILKTNQIPVLKGERRKITVLFSDIRDFTALAERLEPEKLVSQLNEYLEKMLDVIFEHNGTLDKFIGDGLMVEFGAPLTDDKQEIHAIKTAISMHAALKKLNKKWAAEKKPVLSIGIGIHTGFAVVGNIGSEKRMEYTAIGDTVNVAARLEGSTKQLGVPILISEETYRRTENLFVVKDLGPLHLKGRDDPINVYSIEA